MIVNVWQEAPEGAVPLMQLARAEGWDNLPLCEHDVLVAWRRCATDAPGAVMLRRHLPSRQYSAEAVDFPTLVDGLAWEAREWVAVEAWRARRRSGSTADTLPPTG